MVTVYRGHYDKEKNIHRASSRNKKLYNKISELWKRVIHEHWTSNRYYGVIETLKNTFKMKKV